jgi:hypothetical protein
VLGIGVQVDEDVAGGGEAARFARDHEAFARLVHHAHALNRFRHGARRIGTRVVDNKDFVWSAGLVKKGVEAGKNCASLWAQTMTLNLIPRLGSGRP